MSTVRCAYKTFIDDRWFFVWIVIMIEGIIAAFIRRSDIRVKIIYPSIYHTNF
ncbi:hypothetical protein D3C73_1436150 [compost metagenome]